jgi:hypothetical protein
MTMDTRSIFTAVMLMTLAVAPTLSAQAPAASTDGASQLIHTAPGETTPSLWPTWNTLAVETPAGDSIPTVDGARFVRAWALGSLGSLLGSYTGFFAGAVVTQSLEGAFLGGVGGSVLGSGLLAGAAADNVGVTPIIGGLAGLGIVIVISQTGIIRSLPVAAVIQALPAAIFAATQGGS